MVHRCQPLTSLEPAVMNPVCAFSESPSEVHMVEDWGKRDLTSNGWLTVAVDRVVNNLGVYLQVFESSNLALAPCSTLGLPTC